MFLALAVVAQVAEARSNGITGRSITGCSCHNAAADATTTAAFGPAPAVVLPGETVALTLTVSSTNASRIGGGLNVSATDGTFVAGSNTQVSSGEITHTAPQSFVAGAVTFDFEWVAPATDGIYTLSAAGNAVNLTGTSSGDGWNFAANLLIEVDSGCDDTDGDGYDTCEGDCDDANDLVNPGAAELCLDGLDNDCSGAQDDDAVDAGTWYLDADRDGWGAGPAVLACVTPFDHVDRDGDCDDGNAAVNPDAIEVCDAANTDEDCDNLADDASASGATTWYSDLDGDGYGTGAPTLACDAPPDSSALAGDCDDGNSAFNPGAPETDCTDPTDWNCDGSTGFQDLDKDGFSACDECDDMDPTENPAAVETCDGDDDDCDGSADEPDAIDASTWYADADLDNHGTLEDTTLGCTAPPGYVGTSDDCNDFNSAVHPDAAEVWYDGLDQDCDGNDDDQDGDGVPGPAGDCVDTDPSAYPGAPDVFYDGVDSDCSGNDDYDQDGDGHAVAPPFGPGDDCDDVDGAVFPGAADPPCDGIDLDCDPAPDTDPTCAPATTGGTTTGGVDDGKGCGCGSPAPAPGGALLLGLLALARRQRR